MQHSPIVERFLRYVQINTRSVPAKDKAAQIKRGYPSCPGQVTLATMLKEELAPLNLDIMELSDGSFMVILPATSGFENAPHLVFAGHMDTYYGFSGDVKPQIHTYSGGDLVVNKGKDIVISASDLESLEGKQIITSDGTSVLGADNKAGVAGMMGTIFNLVTNQAPHGSLTFWFCTDEEIGEMDPSILPAGMAESWDLFITPDGERLNSIDMGCFIVRWISMTFTGTDAHPGVAGDKLKPAHLAATAFTESMKQMFLTPMESNGLRPTTYVSAINGGPSETELTCKVLSFQMNESNAMARHATSTARFIAKRFGVKVKWKNEVLSHNPREINNRHLGMIQPGIDAIEKVLGHGVAQVDVRGGTDGGMLIMVHPHLLTYNFGTGCLNLHGPQEGLVVDEMEQLPDVMGEMVDRYKDVVKLAA